MFQKKNRIEYIYKQDLLFRRCDRSFPFELKDSSNLENDLVGTSSEFLLINLSVIYRSKKKKKLEITKVR